MFSPFLQGQKDLHLRLIKPMINATTLGKKQNKIIYIYMYIRLKAIAVPPTDVSNLKSHFNV